MKHEFGKWRKSRIAEFLDSETPVDAGDCILIVPADDDADSFNIAFQGDMIAPVAGLVHFGARDFSLEVGRWMEMDPTPAAYVEGSSEFPGVEEADQRGA